MSTIERSRLSGHLALKRQFGVREGLTAPQRIACFLRHLRSVKTPALSSMMAEAVAVQQPRRPWLVNRQLADRADLFFDGPPPMGQFVVEDLRSLSFLTNTHGFPALTARGRYQLERPLTMNEAEILRREGEPGLVGSRLGLSRHDLRMLPAFFYDECVTRLRSFVSPAAIPPRGATFTATIIDEEFDLPSRIMDDAMQALVIRLAQQREDQLFPRHVNAPCVLPPINHAGHAPFLLGDTWDCGKDADSRALQMFLGYLDPVQQETWTQCGYIDFRSQFDRPFRLFDRKRAFSVHLRNEENTESLVGYCIYARDTMPHYDVCAMRFFMLQTDEDRFYRYSNVHPDKKFLNDGTWERTSRTARFHVPLMNAIGEMTIGDMRYAIGL